MFSSLNRLLLLGFRNFSEHPRIFAVFRSIDRAISYNFLALFSVSYVILLLYLSCLLIVLCERMIVVVVFLSGEIFW